MKRIYIRDAEQISLQQPLSEEWMSAPVYCREPYARAVDPDFRLWLSPAESRRLGRILKRALVIGRVIADKTGIGTPDAILVGTG
ncbi:3-oxoacyl-[acyl-carrier-protein] synthase, partial [human gut metagenome]